jgi:exportin-5
MLYHSGINNNLGPNQVKPQDGQEGSTPASKGVPLRDFCLSHQSIVEPLLLFCTHAIRMRDTRCCSIILRVFRSIVPEFRVNESGLPRTMPPASAEAEALVATTAGDPTLEKSLITPESAAAIREYISSDVLRACITSFHEPYFVDLQKELAALIAAIIVYYSPLTNTPKDVLLSLPNVKVSELEKLGEFMAKPNAHTRQQRALVLELLKDLKGVSIAEMGKLPKSAGIGESARAKKVPARSKMVQEFMTAPPQHGPGVDGNADIGRQRGATPDGLEGVANLFGN